jgi:hypothetical protein
MKQKVKKITKEMSAAMVEAAINSPLLQAKLEEAKIKYLTIKDQTNLSH